MSHYEVLSLCQNHGQDARTCLCFMPPGHFFALLYFTQFVANARKAFLVFCTLFDGNSQTSLAKWSLHYIR